VVQDAAVVAPGFGEMPGFGGILKLHRGLGTPFQEWAADEEREYRVLGRSDMSCACGEARWWA